MKEIKIRIYKISYFNLIYINTDNIIFIDEQKYSSLKN